MPKITDNGFLATNAYRGYPLVRGDTVPTGILLDLAVSVPTTHTDVYVDSVYAGPHMLSIVLTSSQGPVAAATLAKPGAGNYEIAPLTPVASGVSGWVALGGGCEEGAYTLGADAGALLPRVVTLLNPIPVSSIRTVDASPSAAMEGNVSFSGSGISFARSGFDMQATLINEASSDFRGVCNLYPDRGECGPVVRSLSGAVPDSNGTITIRFVA